MSAVFNALRSIWAQNLKDRSRVLAMARIDLAKRYSGARLGYMWAIIRPCLVMGVYWFAVAVGARGGGRHLDYPFALWLIAGLVPWFYMSDAITMGGASVRANKRLVTKMVYPIATIPTFTVLSLFFVHVALLALLVVATIASGYGLSIYALQIPYYLFCTLCLSLAIAFPLSALTVLSRDAEQMIKSAVQVIFWLAAIIWPISSLDQPLRALVLSNPICYLVEGYRNAFVYRVWFFDQWQYTAYFWGCVVALALFGSFLFSRSQSEFADVL